MKLTARKEKKSILRKSNSSLRIRLYRSLSSINIWKDNAIEQFGPFDNEGIKLDAL